jgi:hypothetical protein
MGLFLCNGSTYNEPNHGQMLIVQTLKTKKEPKPKKQKTPKPDIQLSPESLWEARIAACKKKGASSLELDELTQWDSSLFTVKSGDLWENCKELVGMDNLPKESKGPFILVVASGALRCIDLINTLKPNTQLSIAKLFAKHLKVPHQITFLQTHTTLFGVGTPARLVKLDQELDFIKNLKLVVFDSSFLDEKKQSLHTLYELQADVWSLLDACNASKIPILLHYFLVKPSFI